jgi:signal transduction histidine kinase
VTILHDLTEAIEKARQFEQLKQASVELERKVQEATAAELEPIIKRSNLAVSTKVRAAVPSVRSARQKVKQIVLNLLSNALKFTPSGSVTMTACYDARPLQVAIAVKDTGVGILTEDQVKVFEDFRQLDSSPARGYGGTGLGLSISRRLAQILGGTIDLDSSARQGSTFTLRLPAKARRR